MYTFVFCYSTVVSLRFCFFTIAMLVMISNSRGFYWYFKSISSPALYRVDNIIITYETSRERANTLTLMRRFESNPAYKNSKLSQIPSALE